MGGGEESSSSSNSLSSEYVYLVDSNPQSTLRSRTPTLKREENDEEKSEYDYGFGDEIASIDLDDIEQTRKATAYKRVLRSYSELQRRSEQLAVAKLKILGYYPGAWVENLLDHDVPTTTTLLLVGPKGSGKSSLINRISNVFEEDKFGVDRAQVSYNSSGDGTCFLQEYRIPRGSKSFCLFDTRGLSDDSSENMKMLEKWMTEGVQHGDPVIRDSDSSSLKSRIEDKELSQGDNVSEKMVNFVIFVVDGLSVLKSMDGDDEEARRQCSEMILTTFNCPFLSFRDDKPVVAVTHGDLLSLSDRARVRVHLGELLGIHPTKQIFDIPENCDPATDMAIVDMLCYALEHADRNLSGKHKMTLMEKVLTVLLGACVFLVLAMGVYMIGVHGTYSCSAQNHQPPPPDSKLNHQPPPLGTKMDHWPPPPNTGTHSCSAQNHQPPPQDTIMNQQPPPLGTKMDLHPPIPGSKTNNQPPMKNTKNDHQTPPLVVEMDNQWHKETEPQSPPFVRPKKQAPPSIQPKKQAPPTVRPKKKTPPLDSEVDWRSIRYLWLGSEYD